MIAFVCRCQEECDLHCHGGGGYSGQCLPRPLHELHCSQAPHSADLPAQGKSLLASAVLTLAHSTRADCACADCMEGSAQRMPKHHLCMQLISAGQYRSAIEVSATFVTCCRQWQGFGVWRILC